MRPFRLLAVLSLISLFGCPHETPPDGGAAGGSAGGSVGGGGAGGGSGGSGGGAAPFIDLDYVAVRFNADGTLDSTFGDAGVARFDLGTGTTNANRELVWSAAKDSTDRLIIFGSAKGSAARTDPDRVAIRLTANGALDTTFGSSGVYRLDVNGQTDAPRHGYVQADGKVVWAGYTTQPNGLTADGGAATTNVPVVVRLGADGALDPTWGDGGVSIPTPPAFARTDGGPWGVVETYNAVLTPNGYVTTGYGRVAATGTVDMVSLRLDTSGQLDPTWNANVGYLVFDLIGGDDRGRNMVALADGRVVIAGSATPTAGTLDGLILFLTTSGTLDTSFNGGLGYRLFDFQGADEPFYGAAVSPNGMQLAAAGWSGGGTNANEDSTLLLLPLMSGAPAESAQKLALSTTANDRFWAVTYDATNHPVAAGFINVAGDTQMVVARFNADGTPDTSFNTTGRATLNVAVGRADETARAVVVQSTGKIVVVGVADH